MRKITRPLVACTSLSILLHGVVFVAALSLVNESFSTTGNGLTIELVSSVDVSSQQEVTVAEQVDTVVPKVKAAVRGDMKSSYQQLVVEASDSVILSAEEIGDKSKQPSVVESLVGNDVLFLEEKEDVALISQATNAKQQYESIVDLLHTRISEKKKYPYLARRQRREGVATIGFVLHPNGAIENAHLIVSSSATTLDHAAISAVKSIEPFQPAQDYLERAKSFEVDVIFNLL